MLGVIRVNIGVLDVRGGLRCRIRCVMIVM